MRHVRLIPQNHMRLIRRNPYGYQSEHSELYSHIYSMETKRRADGHHQCRCCGYPLAAGTPVWEFHYRFGGYGSTFCTVHADSCRWGEAHAKEPPDTRPYRPLPRKAHVERIKRQARPMTKEERKQQEEYAEKCGPITIRFVNPLDL